MHLAWNLAAPRLALLLATVLAAVRPQLTLCARQWCTTWIAVLLCLGSTSAMAAYVSPRIGGSGGDHAYDLDCGDDAVLTGLSGRWGSWMDSIGIICRKVSADGTLGASFTRGPKGGTEGSEAGNPSCNQGSVVKSLRGKTGMYVNGIVFYCGAWSPSSRTVAQASSSDVHRIGAGFSDSGSLLECPPDGKPAKAIRGRYGSYVDSLSLVCDTPVADSPSSGTPAQPGGAAGVSVRTPSVPLPNPINFDEAPAAGAAIALSVSHGSEIKIRASGAAGPLTMTITVLDSRYQPYVELATPPPARLGATPSLPIQRTASITRVLKLKAGVSYQPTTNPGFAVVVAVKDANGAALARSFVIQLQP